MMVAGEPIGEIENEPREEPGLAPGPLILGREKANAGAPALVLPFARVTSAYDAMPVSLRSLLDPLLAVRRLSALLVLLSHKIRDRVFIWIATARCSILAYLH